jgi:3-oxoacyl-[acyl-carrier-protein] synthase II
MSRRALITGRGVLSPLGCDWQAFSRAMVDQPRAPLEALAGGPPDDPVSYHPVPPDGFDLGRREPLSGLATEAARQALADAGVAADGAPLDSVGLVMNTVFGPSTALETYLERLWSGGPRAARPALFVDTLLSMPASRAGIALGLRGSTAVLGGSSALELALDWVRSSRERMVVAGGADWHSPKCLRYHRELARRSGAGRAQLAQGAGFVVVEDAGQARERGAAAFAELLGAGAASEPQEVSQPWSSDPEGRAFAYAMRAALEDAGVSAERVTTVALAAGDDESERAELAALRDVFGALAAALALLRPKRLLGETLGASATLALLAALAHSEGGASGGVALVNGFEMGGAVASVVVAPVAP